MSNRTWACVDCGKTFRRDQSIDAVNCAQCGKPCEFIHWKIHVPSPKNRKAWDTFWLQYRAEKRELEFYQNGKHQGGVTLELLNIQLARRE